MTADALVLSEDKLPDVMTLDLSVPGEVFKAMEAISSGTTGVKLLVLTAFADVERAIQAFDAGAHDFVLKGAPVEDLYEAIIAIRRGEIFLSPSFSQRVAGLRKRTQ